MNMFSFFKQMTNLILQSYFNYNKDILRSSFLVSAKSGVGTEIVVWLGPPLPFSPVWGIGTRDSPLTGLFYYAGFTPSLLFTPLDYLPPSLDYLPPSLDYLPPSLDYLPPSLDYLTPSLDYLPPHSTTSLLTRLPPSSLDHLPPHSTTSLIEKL
jgi:hypothetical protein